MPKYLPNDIKTNSGLDSNRWNEAVEKLSTLISSNSSITREDLLDELNSAVDTYVENIKGFLGTYTDVAPNTMPSVTHHSDTLQLARSNSKILYNEFYRLSDVSGAAFNRISTQQKDLITRLSRISGKSRTLGLYNVDDFLGRFVGESFTSRDNLNIQRTDSALNVDFDSGVVTLPIVESKKLPINTIQIDRSYSNGQSGSKISTEASYTYDNIDSLIDGRPDTWWEYERQQEGLSAPEPLKLRLVLALQTEQIANRITVSSINLGTLSDVLIEGVEGSADGMTWRDMSLDMPLASYRGEQRSSLLKITGQGSIETNAVSLYFKPAPIRYVRVSLSQAEPMLLPSRDGKIVRRLAIGLRDITIEKNTYASTGVLESVFYKAVPPINTLLFMSALSDIDSGLYIVDLSIGFGENQRIGIQPAQSSSLDSNEVLQTGDFGLNPSDLDKLSFRISLTRNDELFSRSDPFASASQKAEQFESFTLARRTPVSYSTNKVPIAETLVIGETPIYCIGKKFRLPTPIGSYASGVNTFASLPFVTKPGNANISWENVKIYVNGKKWNRVANVDNSDVDAEDFTFVNSTDYNTTQVKFGNSGGKDAHRQTTDDLTDTGGKALPDNAVVEACIASEKLLFNYNGGIYETQFKYSFDGNKSGLVIESQSEELTTEEKVLVPGETAYELSPFINGTPVIKQHSTSGTALTPLTTYLTEVPFIDGSLELSTTKYSVDKVNGILYSSDPCPANRITTVTYSYYKRNSLGLSDYALLIEDKKFAGVAIKETNFYSLSKSEALYSYATPFGNPRSGGSSFTDTPSAFEYFPNETYVYTLGSRIAYLSNAGIVQGTLFIDDSSGGVATEIKFINGVTEFGAGAEFDIDTGEMRYSVDYKKGLLYLASPFTTKATAAAITIRYQYATYRASYSVSNPVTDYKLNGNIIEFNGDSLSGLSNGQLRVYYQYKPLAELGNVNLAKLYTPLLRDVQIRYV